MGDSQRQAVLTTNSPAFIDALQLVEIGAGVESSAANEAQSLLADFLAALVAQDNAFGRPISFAVADANDMLSLAFRFATAWAAHWTCAGAVRWRSAAFAQKMD